MSNRVLSILLILFISISIYTTSAQPTSLEHDSGVLLCSQVTSNGKYVLRKSNIISFGEEIYLYNKVKIRKGTYNSYNLIWDLRIYDPLGMISYRGKAYTGIKEFSGKEIEYFVYFAWSPKIGVEGKYKIVLTIKDLISGVKKVDISYVYLRGGITRTVKYNLNYTLFLKNTSNKRAKVDKLYLAIVQSFAPFQKVIIGPIFNLKPAYYVNDKFGNKYAVFKDLIVPPFSYLSIKVRYVIYVTYVHFKPVSSTLAFLSNLPESIKRFTKPEKYIESNSGKIIQLATMIKGDESRIYNVLSRIENFTASYIKYDPSVGYDKGALWVYENRRGICGHYSRFYVAIARALGIPSQTVLGFGFLNATPNKLFEGLMYNSKNVLKSIGHIWVLVYIPEYGWIPVEPQLSSTHFGYTNFGSSEPKFHIILVRNWKGDERVKVDGDKIFVNSYTFWYTGGKINPYEIVSWKTQDVENKANAQMSLLYNNTVYAGGIFELSVRLNIPVNDSIFIQLFSPNGSLVTTSSILYNGKASLKEKIPAKLSNIGIWNARITWFGNEKYYPIEKNVTFNAIKKQSRIVFTIPHEIYSGENLVITGALIPKIEGEKIEILMRSPSGKLIEKEAVTNSEGMFKISINTGNWEKGLWNITVLWNGGEKNFVYSPVSSGKELLVKENMLIKALPIIVLLVVIVIVIIIIIKRTREKTL